MNPDEMDNLPGWMIKGRSGSIRSLRQLHANALAERDPLAWVYADHRFADWYIRGWRAFMPRPQAERTRMFEWLVTYNTRDGNFAAMLRIRGIRALQPATAPGTPLWR
jgi:hypothetical protein